MTNINAACTNVTVLLNVHKVKDGKVYRLIISVIFDVLCYSPSEALFYSALCNTIYSTLCNNLCNTIRLNTRYNNREFVINGQSIQGFRVMRKPFYCLFLLRQKGLFYSLFSISAKASSSISATSLYAFTESPFLIASNTF